MDSLLSVKLVLHWLSSVIFCLVMLRIFFHIILFLSEQTNKQQHPRDYMFLLGWICWWYTYIHTHTPVMMHTFINDTSTLYQYVYTYNIVFLNKYRHTYIHIYMCICFGVLISSCSSLCPSIEIVATYIHRYIYIHIHIWMVQWYKGYPDIF